MLPLQPLRHQFSFQRAPFVLLVIPLTLWVLAPNTAWATEMTRVEFASVDARYRFSAEIPAHWKLERVPAIDALNLYDPTVAGKTAREQSQVFLRFFRANRFLTLPTVTIYQRIATKIGDHEAVRYEIEKKSGVTNFPQQPSWRNARHRLIDIRLTRSSPSFFYVIAANPTLDTAVFERIISSLRFHNDREAFLMPLARARERITKKPFGLKISPNDSPISPERFSGYHTGVDFETFPEEASQDIEVRAICSGPLQSVRTAKGYGGVAVQECMLGEETVSIIYGHIRASSVKAKPGTFILAGDRLGVLGATGSAETDGERKHLHLGMFRGSKPDIRGYVPRKIDLVHWRDPLTIAEKNSTHVKKLAP